MYIISEVLELTQTQSPSDETKNDVDDQENEEIYDLSASPQLCLDMKGDTIASATALHSYNKKDHDEFSMNEGKTLDFGLARNNISGRGLVPSHYVINVLPGGKCKRTRDPIMDNFFILK